MPEREILSQLYEGSPTFRKAVFELLGLDVPSLEQLTGHTDFQTSSDLEDALALTGDRVKQLLRVAHTLYDVQGLTEDQDILEELKELVVKDGFDEKRFEGRRLALEKLIESNPDRERAEERLRVEASMLPVVQYAQVAIDLRAQDDPEDKTLRYVPVVVARLGFDEPVHGRAAVFQLTETGLDIVLGALAGAKNELAQVRDDLKGKLL